MTVTRVYETRVANDRSGLTARLMAVPARFVDEAYSEDPERLLTSPGLEFVERVTAAGLIPSLAQILLWAELAAGDSGGAATLRDFGDRGPESRHWNFAAYLAFQPIVPFERSPPEGVSIGALLSASPAAAGAVTGFAVAGSSVPLLLILVPGGALVAHFGTAFARGAARPMEQAGEYLSAQILERLVPGFRHHSPPDKPDTANDGNG